MAEEGVRGARRVLLQMRGPWSGRVYGGGRVGERSAVGAAADA